MILDRIHVGLVNLLEFEDAAEMHMEADGLLVDTLKELYEMIHRYEAFIDIQCCPGDSVKILQILEAYKNVPKAYHSHSIAISPDSVVSESGD